MTLHQFHNGEAVSHACAEWIVDDIRQKLITQSRFTWLLSGGTTPQQLYRLLATEKFKSQVDWQRLHIFFGDERFVPFNDERNNGHMAARTLIDHVDIPKSQVHFMNTDKEPGQCADDYDKILRQYFESGKSSFDLALLGMGDDGHTLSIFPGSSLVDEKENWVNAIYVPSQQMHRITLMPVIVNMSHSIIFLVTGRTKAHALKEVLQGEYRPAQYPAQLIKPAGKELHWFIDDAAAASLG